MKYLEAFSHKDLRTVKTVMMLMEKHSITLDDFTGFMATPTPSKPHKPATYSMKSGETEINGLHCSCGSKVVTEAFCGSTAIKKNAIRIAYCLECEQSYKIR